MKQKIFFSSEKRSCSTCKNVSKNKNGENICKFRAKLNGGNVCRKYIFDPFAHRVPRPRSVDTSMFDPLDFKID